MNGRAMEFSKWLDEVIGFDNKPRCLYVGFSFSQLQEDAEGQFDWKVKTGKTFHELVNSGDIKIVPKTCERISSVLK